MFTELLRKIQSEKGHKPHNKRVESKRSNQRESRIPLRRRGRFGFGNRYRGKIYEKKGKNSRTTRQTIAPSCGKRLFLRRFDKSRRFRVRQKRLIIRQITAYTNKRETGFPAYFVRLLCNYISVVFCIFRIVSV